MSREHRGRGGHRSWRLSSSEFSANGLNPRTLSLALRDLPSSPCSYLHLSSLGRRHFGVINLDLPRRHLVQTLRDDSKGLAHLLHPAQVPEGDSEPGAQAPACKALGFPPSSFRAPGRGLATTASLQSSILALGLSPSPLLMSSDPVQ